MGSLIALTGSLTGFVSHNVLFSPMHTFFGGMTCVYEKMSYPPGKVELRI